MKQFLAFASLASAALAHRIPFFRRDNSTSTLGYQADIVSGASTSIVTVDEYVTIVLPSTTAVVAKSATSDMSALAASLGVQPNTTTVTEYSTLTSGDVTTTVPYTTYTTDALSASPVTTTTTITLTTLSDTSTHEEKEATDAASGECTPKTVTVTVDGGSSPSTEYVTSTVTTSFPVVATFANGNDTSTITSYVQVTSTLLYPATSSSVAPGLQNGTYSFPSKAAGSGKKRGFAEIFFN